MADTLSHLNQTGTHTPDGFAEISVREIKAALAEGRELAFFDVRDEADYATGHILYASHLPFGRLELLARNLIPLAATRIVLTDNGERIAEQAAAILRKAGYKDVRLLEGRNAGWTAAGYELYTGRNVPGIGFFEVIEHERGTPNISAVELKARLDRGDDVVILDTRPRDEFEAFHIPGAINAPGSEILHRLGSLDIRPETLIVANCAGRTRSILGAQSLIDAGVRNPVASLTGGTMEWLIAGYKLEHGQGNTAGFAEQCKLVATRQLAHELARKHDVSVIDHAALDAFRLDTSRSLFLFDVRSPEEYAAGHPRGFRHAAGGQLASGAERFVGVRGARVVLYDPDGVRDRLTAAWLVQLGGYEVHVIDDLGNTFWESGPEPRNIIAGSKPAPYVLPATLRKGLDASEPLTVLDVSDPNQYRKAHIPGARYLRRAELETAVREASGTVVLTSENGVLAQVLAADLREATGQDVRAVLGGNDAWRGAGLPVEKDGIEPEAGADLPDKYALEPSRRNSLFRDYLEWEVSLVERLTNDPDAQATFRLRA